MSTIRTSLHLFLLAVLSAACLTAQPTLPSAPLPPVSVAEPPGADAVSSLTASTQASPPEFLTTEEKSAYSRTGSYDEAVNLARAIERKSRHAKLLSIGRTAEGRELYVLIASKDRAFTPAAVERSGKPMVLVQNAIHSGEVAGKGATLMLMRDLLVSGLHASLLDQVHVAALLVFNADAHEMATPFARINQNGPAAMGYRATAQRLNLNRDFVKADAPEMQAWLSFYNAWLPHLLIDHHVTNGMDHQYDLTIDMPENEDTGFPLARWTRDRFLPTLYQRMEADGHVMAPYGYFNPAQPERGYRTQIFSPRYSQAYAAARNRVGLLVETHSLKSFRTRVWSHYDVTLHALQAVAAEPGRMLEAVRLTERATQALGGSDGMLFLEGKHSEASEPFVFRGVTVEQREAPVAGGTIPVYRLPLTETPTRLYRRQQAAVQVKLPEAWAIPAAWAHLAPKLRLHGVPIQTLDAARTGRCEQYSLHDPQFSQTPVEGRFLVTVRTQAQTADCSLPPGTLLVSARHPSARIAAHLLEPQGPDSLLHWGFLHSVLTRTEYFSPYTMEPIAQKMLEEQPALRAEFETKLAEDETFRTNPRQRLEWFFNRSAYAEPGYREYPILRVWFTR
jgi:hypothetical protein